MLLLLILFFFCLRYRFCFCNCYCYCYFYHCYCYCCVIVIIFVATWVTEDNARVSENPFFFCTLCYKRFNFKVELVTLRGIGHICHRFNRTDSNTCILQRNVVGLRYFKIWILLHQMIKYQSFPPSGFRIYCISKLSTKPLGKTFCF